MEIPLRESDIEVYSAIQSELKREMNSLVMIASENYASKAVMEAQASVMTNKYAEGYPGSRYYGGCDYVDVVERLAIDRARRLFNAQYVNVQPHSGSQANMAVYFSFLEPGDTILGMELSHGGHLTHGSEVSFSGRIFRSVSYGVRPGTHLIDYDQVRDLAKCHNPRMIIAGASAYPRIIDFYRFRDIADQFGSYLMVDMAHIAGLVAAGLHPSPVGVADFVTSTTHKTLRGPRGGLIIAEEKYGSKIDKGIFPGIQGGPLMHVIAAKAAAFSEALQPGFARYQEQVVRNSKALAEELKELGFDLITGGTDNHLVLIDLTNFGLSGLEAEQALGRVGIVANKNAVPFDKRGPKVTSGLRLGTPALTTRGLTEGEMRRIAGIIKRVLDNPHNDTTLKSAKVEVADICNSYPIYSSLDTP